MNIYKFDMPVEENPKIEMPEGATILHIDSQFGNPDTLQVWALCTPENAPEQRQFHCFGTGHELPANPGTYLGTVLTADGQLVWHCFEVV